jgi:hypothetical protein
LRTLAADAVELPAPAGSYSCCDYATPRQGGDHSGARSTLSVGLACTRYSS